jgi:hypothetical protein
MIYGYKMVRNVHKRLVWVCVRAGGQIVFGRDKSRAERLTLVGRYAVAGMLHPELRDLESSAPYRSRYGHDQADGVFHYEFSPEWYWPGETTTAHRFVDWHDNADCLPGLHFYTRSQMDAVGDCDIADLLDEARRVA